MNGSPAPGDFISDNATSRPSLPLEMSILNELSCLFDEIRRFQDGFYGNPREFSYCSSSVVRKPLYRTMGAIGFRRHRNEPIDGFRRERESSDWTIQLRGAGCPDSRNTRGRLRFVVELCGTFTGCTGLLGRIWVEFRIWHDRTATKWTA